MARTTLPIEDAPGATPLTEEVLTFTAADTVNGNQFVHTGRELLIVDNTDAGAQTVTFTSVAINGRQDPANGVAQSVPAGERRMYGPFKEGWRQTDGFLYLDGATATITFAVIRLPQ